MAGRARKERPGMSTGKSGGREDTYPPKSTCWDGVYSSWVLLIVSCMASLTLHYFEFNWKSCICSCSCGRSEDPTGGIQTRTWRRICYFYKWFSGLQLILWDYFLFFSSSWFLLCSFACLQRKKEKHVLHPVLQQTLPGPLPLLVEAAASLLSLSKACMLHMPQDHLPLAHGDSQENWLFLSQLTLGVSLALAGSPPGRGSKVSLTILLQLWCALLSCLCTMAEREWEERSALPSQSLTADSIELQLWVLFLSSYPCSIAFFHQLAHLGRNT